MAKPASTHFVVTASLTDSGAPAYFRASGDWGTNLSDAQCIDSEDQAVDIAKRAESQAQRLVCDPYSFPVALQGNDIDPLTARERIRAGGPTVPVRRPD